MQSYLDQKNPEEFQKDLTGQHLGSELVGNLQKNTKWYTWKKFKSCLRWILNYFFHMVNRWDSFWKIQHSRS